MQLPNLLNTAVKLTGTQAFTYYKYAGRIDNGIGQDITQYNPPIQIRGQVQAVPRNLYEMYGLDLQKTYLTFYVSKDILDLQRDVSGDQIQFAGSIYKCESETDWRAINGWTGVLAVRTS